MPLKGKKGPIPDAVEPKGNGKKDIEVVDDPGGQIRVPGTERKAVKPLINFWERREETKAAHKRLTAELKEQNDIEGPMLFEKYKEHFTETDDGFTYVSGKVEIDMVKGLKVRTREIADED